MIRFSKYIFVYAVISALVIVPGVYFMIRYGFRQSIDFSGGTLLEVSIDRDINTQVFSDAAESVQAEVSSIQPSENNDYIVRTKALNSQTAAAFIRAIQKYAKTEVTVLRNETVGPTLGSELLKKTVFAALFAIAAILGYIAWAFKNIRFGVAAVVALIHDLLVVLGSFSILGQLYGVEVDTLFVTAFLTTMSFSVHDTIVVFDRIREYYRRDRFAPFDKISDRALTETMNRSLVNSFTIVFMLLALILMGGETIRWFVVALLIGTVSGTYSSPFVATSVLVLWHKHTHAGK